MKFLVNKQHIISADLAPDAMELWEILFPKEPLAEPAPEDPGEPPEITEFWDALKGVEVYGLEPWPEVVPLESLPLLEQHLYALAIDK